MNNFNTLKSYSNAFGANLPDFYNGQVRNLDRLVDGKDYFIRSMGVGNPPDSVEITKTFYYGSDGQRVLMVSQEDNVIVSKKYYVGEYEYTVYPSPAPAKEVTFISSPTGLIAANVKIDTTTTFYYVLTDHLGSITQLLKSNGDIVADAQFTYDAWGRLRDVVNYPNAPYTTNAYQQEQFHILDRGYTGHEHLLDHDIINMNGRIYDPVVGQFLQADNYIQTPEDYIGYNRYAYCRYNPFKYTDPSGEFWVGKRGETSVWYDEVEVYGSNPYLTVPLVSGVDYKPASYGNFNYSLLDWFNFPCLKFRSCGTQSLLRVRGTGSSNGSGIDARDETAKYNLANKKNQQVSNPSTQRRNYKGTNYILQNDPEYFDGWKDFTPTPINRPDRYAWKHDIEFTNLGYWTGERTGTFAFLLDTRTLGADYRFVKGQIGVVFDYKHNVSLTDRSTAWTCAVVIGVCAIPKAIVQLAKPFPLNVYQIMYYNALSQITPESYRHGRSRSNKKR